MKTLLFVALTTAVVGLIISVVIFFKLIASRVSNKKTMIDFQL